MTSSQAPPHVSIILPTYNEKPSIVKQAIESVTGQTYDNIECIVVDGGHGGWLKDFCTSLENCEYIYKENEGVSAARNAGLDKSKGKYLGFLDADDYFSKNKISKQVNCLEQGADIVYSDVIDIYPPEKEKYREAFYFEKGKKHIEFFRFDGRKGNIHTSSLLIRDSILDGERFHHEIKSGQDFHLWVRLFEKTNQVKRIPQPLVYVHQRDTSLSSKPDLVYKNRLKAIEDLCNNYHELNLYKQERKEHEKYAYARDLLFEGRSSESRPLLYELAWNRRQIRPVILFLVSLIPFGKMVVLKTLDRLQSMFNNKYTVK